MKLDLPKPFPRCRPPRQARVRRSAAARSATLVALLITAFTAWPTMAQDPAAQRLLLEAERLKNSGEVESATDEYLLLAQQFPTDQLRPQALLAVAEIRSRLDDLSGAQAALDTLLADHPRTAEAARAFLLKGDIQVRDAANTDDLATARATFRRIPLLYGAENFPALPARAQALLRSAELGLFLGDPDTAAAEALTVIEDQSTTTARGQARILYARALLRRGEHTAATEVLERLGSGVRDDESPDGDLREEDRAQAQRLLTLIHRHFLRPLAGEPRFAGGGRLSLSGATLREPTGVAAAEDGRLLVVDDKDSVVYQVAADGTVEQRRALEKPGRPGWVDGVAFVVTNERLLVPSSGQSMSFLEPRSGREVPLDGMQVATRGLFGHWYILAKGWKSLLAFEGRRVGQELLAKNRPDLRDLERDSEGRLYVLDKKSGQVGRLGPDRRWQGAVVQGDWRRPEALAVDPLGNFYVLDRGSRTISIYNGDGNRLASVGPTFRGGIELKSPEDITVDGSGRLFIADSDLPFLVVLD